MVTGALSGLLNNTCSNVASDPSHRNIDQEQGLEAARKKERLQYFSSLSLMDEYIVQLS